MNGASLQLRPQSRSALHETEEGAASTASCWKSQLFYSMYMVAAPVQLLEHSICSEARHTH